MFLSTLAILSLAGFALLAIFAAVRDIRTMTIPNGLILTLLAGYLVLAAGSGWSREEISTSLLAATIVLFAGLLVYALGFIGAGDGKYAAVCCLWLGASNTMDFLFLTSVFGAAIAALVLCLPRLGDRLTKNRSPGMPRHKLSIPYGVAISAAALVLVPYSPWVSGLT